MTLIPERAGELLIALPESVLVMDSYGSVVFFNHAAETQTGYAANEMVGEHVSILLPPNERRRLDVVSWLSRWATTPNPDQLRYLTLTGVHKDSSVHQYRVKVSVLQDDEAMYFTVLLRDVTEEQAELLRLRHEKLVSERIVDIGQDAVLTIDAGYHIGFWNRQAVRLFGYTEQEVLGQPLSMLLPEAYRGNHEKMINGFLADKAPSRFMGDRGEITGRHKDGRILPLEASITKVEVGGELILSAQVRDISERKRIESSLQESESRFRAIFEQALEAIALLDPAGKVLLINNSARGWLPADSTFDDVALWDLNWWVGTDAGGVAEARLRLQSDVTTASEGQPVHARYTLSGDQGSRDIDFSLIPVTDSNGVIINILAEARELTEQ